MVLFADGESLGSVHPDDGLLELFTLQGPLSIMQMTVAKKLLHLQRGNVQVLEHPHRVEIEMQTGQFFQMDGEPWMLKEGCTVIIEHHTKVRMLCPPREGDGAGVWHGRQRRDFWSMQPSHL